MSRYAAIAAVALATLALSVTGCDECDDEGQTWCEGDVVMVCEVDEDDGDWETDDDDWEEDDGEDDGDEAGEVVAEILILLIIAIVDASDEHHVAREAIDCAEYGLVCAERRSPEEGTYAVCEHEG